MEAPVMVSKARSKKHQTNTYLRHVKSNSFSSLADFARRQEYIDASSRSEVHNRFSLSNLSSEYQRVNYAMGLLKTSLRVAIAVGLPQLNPIFAPSGMELSSSLEYPKASATVFASMTGNQFRYYNMMQCGQLTIGFHPFSCPSAVCRINNADQFIGCQLARRRLAARRHVSVELKMFKASSSHFENNRAIVCCLPMFTTFLDQIELVDEAF
jgi:hypothetical protein